MQITHEQAHRLVQRKLDNALTKEQSAVLSAHLQECADCEAYLIEMKEVEGLLSPVMKRQWAAQPIPLSIAMLGESKAQTQTSILLTMRTAAMGLVVIALFFSLWQFMTTGSSAGNPAPLVVPLVPTPSSATAQFTNTTESCEMLVYAVQENDTLASIAERFSAAEDEIMAINDLKVGALKPSMELLIPVCNYTPTGTVHPATLTTTYTPNFRSTASTPDG
jgi:LysM repeat protein